MFSRRLFNGMHEKLLADAFNSVGCVVLNMPLLSFTIGHELALWRSGNPIVMMDLAGFKNLPIAEKSEMLASAVLLCRNEKNAESEKLASNESKWIKEASSLDLDAEIGKFFSYRLSCSMTFPTVTMPRAQGSPFHYFGAPEMARLINYVSVNHALMIQSHFGGSPLNFPLGLARMLNLTSLECDGNVWIENWKDAEEKERRELYDKLHPESGVSVGEVAVKESIRKWNIEHPDAKVPE